MEYQYPKLSLPTDQELTVASETEFPVEFSTSANKAEYEVRNTVLVDGGDRFGVSSVVFDKHEELIWMGNQGGHVTSYYGPTMQKYTSFQIHASEEVRDIITADEGIYALTKSTLRHQIRRGIPKHTFKSENMIDMQCIFHVSTTKILMGGHQNNLLELDLKKMKETVIPIEEDGCAVLRSGGGSLVTCGSVGGMVTLRDVRSPSVAQHSFRAHSACLSDLDMQGDLLISCGFSHTSNGVAIADTSVIVWDVRCLTKPVSEKGVWSANVSWPPLLLHFLPTVSGRALAVAGDGNVALLNVNEPTVNEYASIFQVDTQNTSCSVVDISSTSQALVFGDQSGHLNLFSARHNTEPIFNNFSRDTEFADPIPTIPFAGLKDDKFRFSSIPRVPLSGGEKWFNEFSPEFYKVVYRKPKPIDPEILKTMKMQGPIGYAPNPKTCKRNEMPYLLDSLEDLKTHDPDENINSLPIPKYYLKVDSRLNKNEKEVEPLNIFPTLQSNHPNSYCNSMLQVLYYTVPVKATLLAHVCAKEFCLSCELGFLFRLLDKSKGVACEATNFLRAFRTAPEAAALGLILPDTGIPQRVDLVTLIQSWNRFILHQMHYEILGSKKKAKELVLVGNSNNSPPKSCSRLGNPPLNTTKINNRIPNGHIIEEYKYTEIEYITPSSTTTEFENQNGDLNGYSEVAWRSNIGPEEENVPSCNTLQLSSKDESQESEISKLFAIGRSHLNKCLKCNKEEERTSVVLACALQYPAAARVSPRVAGFVSLLKTSLAARRNTPAWCDRCRRFSPTLQRARLHRLPPVLSINCGGVSPHEKAYWTKEFHKDVAESSRRIISNKPCRYGLHCSRPGCRFKHPDRAGTSNSCVVEPSSHCVLPLHMSISLHKDGDVSILDKSNPKTAEGCNGESKEVQIELEYSLSAAVICVEDSPKNLVAFINTRPGSEPNWHLFNDTHIVPVDTEEVVEYSAWWKSPCVLLYTNTSPGVRRTYPGRPGHP